MKQVEQLRNSNSPSALQHGKGWQVFLTKTWQRCQHLPFALARHQLPSGPSGSATSVSSQFPSHNPLPQGSRRRTPSPILIGLAVVTLTGSMGQRFYNQPKLDVGTKSPQTIKAPWDAKVPDHKTTEEERKAARNGSIPQLKINPAVERQVSDQLEQFFQQGNELRDIAGSFPYLNTGVISGSTQEYLRRISGGEWNAILAQVKGDNVSPGTGEAIGLPATALPHLNSDAPSYSSNLQQKAISELLRHRQQVATPDFLALLDDISGARSRYQTALKKLSEASVSELAALYNTTLFDLSDAAWKTTQTGIAQIARRMLLQGIPDGLPPHLLKQAVKFQVDSVIPDAAHPLAIQVLTTLLQPNLVKDQEATRLRAELAAQKVQPVKVSVQKGEVIVKEGEVITQKAFVLLDYFGLSRREVNWRGIIAFTGVISIAIGGVLLVERQFYPSFLRRRDHILLWFLAVITPILMALGIPWTCLPAVGILVGSFYSSAVAMTVVAMLSIVLPIGMEIEIAHLIASAAGGLLGSLMAGRLRCREELALLGGGVGLTQGMVYLLVTLIGSAAAGSILATQLGAVALECLAGLAWSIIALGLSPYLEHLFDLITPIRLAELANPNRPLLKRLAAEAPGTFQHTLFVATLAEAAAQAIGCNVELVRTGTLYHDIGKMHDPMGFIENQMSAPNKHDEINDPWISAQIIKKHVTEGLVMAKKYRLPKAIRAFIPEHQGTMLISYFYYQAQQLAANGKGREVREEDFRYDGPIPQSRETGIVMLADSCEAALRSLEYATHEEALQMVHKIIRSRWQENQLVDSGLTREEMSKIAAIFVRVWEQVNHKRIAYPKAVLSCR